MSRAAARLARALEVSPDAFVNDRFFFSKDFKRLAGLTPREEFEVDYQEIADLRKLPSLPVDYDLVAISTFTAQLKEAWEVARDVIEDS